MSRLELSESDHKKFRSLVGGLMWICNAYRWDCKFACFILTLWMHKPRMWDYYLAIWLLEYLKNSSDVPLVLGGDKVEVQIYTDASFGTLPESRSPKGHLVKLNELSGAVYCEVHCVSIAVKRIYEAELIACSEGCDTAQFVMNALEELEVPTKQFPQLRTDSEAVIKWLKGRSVTQYSRHLKPKYYGTRHVVKDGLVNLEFIPGVDNPADILTKFLPMELHVKHLKNVMGHNLVDFEMRGVARIFEQGAEDQEFE